MPESIKDRPETPEHSATPIKDRIDARRGHVLLRKQQSPWVTRNLNREQHAHTIDSHK